MVIVDYISSGKGNRPGVDINPMGVTVHNTDNPGATAIDHAKYLKGTVAEYKKVSWHYTVDDICIVQHLPDTEMGYHTGTFSGNISTIGVEICEVKDQASANKRAAKLIRELVARYNLKIFQHYHWNKKNCPRLLRPIWEEFMRMVQLPIIQREITGSVNGRNITGYLIDNTTYVPLRQLGHLINGQVEWDGTFKMTTREQELMSEINRLKSSITRIYNITKSEAEQY